MIGRIPTLLAAGLVAGGALAPAGAQNCGLSPPQQSYIQRALAPSFASIAGLGGTTQDFGPCATMASVPVTPFPFPFTYFGQAETILRIQKNGFLHFTTFAGFPTTGNSTIPTATAPNDLVAPFWDVLVPAAGTGGVFHRTDGAAPNRIFTAEWKDMMILSGATPCFDNGSRLNFQAKLFEADGSVEFHYGPFNPGTVAASISATIGLENNAGAIGVDVTGFGALNAAFPATDLRFFPGAVSSVVQTYTVSTPPPSFSTIAGAPGATQVFFPPSGGTCFDDEAVSLGLTFPFSFWGEPKPAVQFSMNGIVAFDFSLGMPGAGNPNPAFPAPGTPNDWAAAWHDDLVADDPGATTGGWFLTSGPVGNRVLTMEWVNLSIFDPVTGVACTDTGDRINCQLEFHEAGNTVVCKYGTQLVGAGPNSATVAVENKFGTAAVDGTGNGTNNSSFPATDIVFTPCVPIGLVIPFGNGCPGSLGAPPSIGSSGGAPVIGNATFALTMSGGPPSSPANGLIIGASGSQWLVFNLPMSMGILGFPAACSLFASADIFSPPLFTTPGGAASLTLPIPNLPILIGGSAFAQFFSLTPVLAITNGAEVRIG
ncbi:MAG TPA: hypothetical protein VFI25_03580 [Planctomycetota bacterium]|jgi:hypothetical protein|nr:hypothetical protein [Planctomycetota bacterium]